MKTFKKIMLASIVLLLTISCKKDDLPKATQEGKNIMAAKVNGEIWKATACWSCLGAGSGLSASYEQSYLNVSGQLKNEGSNFYIHFFFLAPSVGQYSISGDIINNKIEAIDFLKDKTYYPSAAFPGIIKITKLDRTRKIISGTFSFKAENKDDPNDVVVVTDGRFDVTYN